MFNLFAEDPVAAVISANPMPWTTYFEKEAGPEDEKVTLEEGQGEKMLVWRNEEFGNLGDIKKNAKEERPTWAGRNPMAAYKIGKTGKNITSELSSAYLGGTHGSTCILARCDTARCGSSRRHATTH